MTRVKVCGLTRIDDVDRALALGADMLGFIHVPESPRFVPFQRLAELLARAAGKAERCVVVRDLSDDGLGHLRANLEFEYFQFHGDESPETVRRWRGYKVIHMGEGEENRNRPGDYGEPYLLDTSVRGQRGGTGKRFDWTVLPSMPGTFLVAGGLNPGNVAELVREYRPWGVDVSSGIEAEPGRKDHDAMARFINHARSAV